MLPKRLLQFAIHPSAEKSYDNDYPEAEERCCDYELKDLESGGHARSGLTKKAEPLPTRGVNRDSGTASANGGWLRRLVRPHGSHLDLASHLCASAVCS